MMKGSSLPMDSVVMLILAVLVLSAVVFFFFGTFNPSTDVIKAQQTIAAVCVELAQYKCDINIFSGKGGTDSDFTAAQNAKMSELDSACAVTKAATFTGTGATKQSCIKIFCRMCCPSNTTTTKP